MLKALAMRSLPSRLRPDIAFTRKLTALNASKMATSK